MAQNDKALALILATAIAIPCEGLRQWAYRDSTGLPTICLGSTKGVKMGDFRTVPECKALLTKEMSDVISAVDTCRPGLPTPILAAFSDASYNVGVRIACGTGTTAARHLKAGNYLAACQELPKWVYAKVAGFSVQLPGLVTRRNLDYELCLSGL
jgi:lysozyme